MFDYRSARTVAVERIAPEYPRHTPFHPAVKYPEYEGPVGDEPNAVYEAVRQLFVDLELDVANFGRPEWNPLGDLIRTGDKVFIKPNIVLHKNYSGQSVDAVITHGSVVRAVADYVVKALRGSGRLLIGDAPVQQCDFAAANAHSGLDGVARYLKSIRTDIDLLDLRLVSSAGSALGVRERVEGDPVGYEYVDLDGASEHSSANDFRKFRVTNYDPSFMMQHHNETKHEYIVSRSILESNVVISVCKLKTHRKAGISVTLKNLVGINGHKDCLPHHKTGSHFEGGDEYLDKNPIKRVMTRIQEVEDVQTSSLPRLLAKIPKRLLREAVVRGAKDKTFEGSWWGNDTIWRTVIDLNRILYYWGVEENALQAEPRRRLISIVDGVIAGEAEGPLHPDPKPAGLLMAGFNPAAVDATAARLMDFDWRKIKAISNAMRAFADFAPEDVVSVSSLPELRGTLLTNSTSSFFGFRPGAGWKGHIELS